MKSLTASEMGKRGGRARARALSADERKAIARQGGLAKAALNGNATALPVVETADVARIQKQKKEKA